MKCDSGHAPSSYGGTSTEAFDEAIDPRTDSGLSAFGEVASWGNGLSDGWLKRVGDGG